MLVPLLVNDFIDRAELLYPDRIGIVDEPLQPAESWSSLTYRDVAARARAMAAGLDELEIGMGERVAIVSHNSARLITALFVIERLWVSNLFEGPSDDAISQISTE